MDKSRTDQNIPMIWVNLEGFYPELLGQGAVLFQRQSAVLN